LHVGDGQKRLAFEGEDFIAGLEARAGGGALFRHDFDFGFCGRIECEANRRRHRPAIDHF
jgi:hypothetical protein